MWLRGMIIISVGIFIDGLQAAFAWMFISLGLGLQAISPLGGAIGGGAAGCAAGFVASSDAVTGIVKCVESGVAAAVAGATASAFGGPLGMALAFLSDVCISLTMGAGFILLLFMFRMFYPAYIWGVFIGESIPGLDVLPGWTLLAVRCVLKKNAESGEGGSIVTLASAALSPAGATGGVGRIVGGIVSVKSATKEVSARSTPLINKAYESKPIQDIAHSRQQLAGDVRHRMSEDMVSHSAANNNTPLHAKAA